MAIEAWKAEKQRRIALGELQQDPEELVYEQIKHLTLAEKLTLLKQWQDELDAKMQQLSALDPNSDEYKQAEKDIADLQFKISVLKKWIEFDELSLKRKAEEEEERKRKEAEDKIRKEEFNARRATIRMSFSPNTPKSPEATVQPTEVQQPVAPVVVDELVQDVPLDPPVKPSDDDTPQEISLDVLIDKREQEMKKKAEPIYVTITGAEKIGSGVSSYWVYSMYIEVL